MISIFDPYEIRARVFPAILVSLSPVITGITFLSLLQESPDFILRFLGSGSVVAVFIYLMSFVVRYYGRKIQPKLWKDWDGPPSTRFLRWRDSTFDDVFKQKLHKAVNAECEISLYSKEDEENDPQTADKRIRQAFMQVSAIVRREDPKGLWNSHNAEYGYHRNLVGSRNLWLILTLLGTILCGIYWYQYNNDSVFWGLVMNVILLISTIFLGWYFLPESAKITSDNYGVSIWNSFLVSTTKK